MTDRALARAISLVILAAGVASCGNQSSPTTTGSHTAAAGSPSVESSGNPPPLTQTFASALMGYSVSYPEGWNPAPATTLWEPGGSNFWDDPVGDRIESATAGFRGTSQALPADQSPDEWLQAYLADAPTDCGEPEQIVVDGATGTIDLNGCDGLGRLGGRVYDVVVVADGRGYDFTMEGDVDHALLVAMLGTVSLEPANAASTN